MRRAVPRPACLFLLVYAAAAEAAPPSPAWATLLPLPPQGTTLCVALWCANRKRLRPEEGHLEARRVHRRGGRGVIEIPGGAP